MKISEMPHQAEELIEQSKQAHTALKASQMKTAQAQARMRAAQNMLDYSQELDEDGNPRGDSSYARELLAAATSEYYAASGELFAARGRAAGLDHQKEAAAEQLENYSEVSKRNLTALEMLQKKRFGSNISGCVADIVNRMNVAEDTRDRLLQSMGKSPGKRRAGVSGGGSSGGAGDSVHNDGSIPYATFIQGSDRDGKAWLDKVKKQNLSYTQYTIMVNDIISNSRLTSQEKNQQILWLDRAMKQYALSQGWIKKTTGKVQLYGISFPDDVKASRSYVKQLINRMENSSDEMKALFEQYGPRMLVADDDYYNPSSGAHYMPEDGFCICAEGKDSFMLYEQRGIHLDADADETNECGKGSTFYHEAGHMLDHLMGQDLTGDPNGWLSDDTAYQEAFQQDIQNLENCWNNMTEEQKQAFNKTMYLPRNASLCDLLNAVSSGEIRGKYGHEAAYWQNTPSALYREGFAHFTEASMGDSYKQTILRQHFPKAWKRYNELLSDDKINRYGGKTKRR